MAFDTMSGGAHDPYCGILFLVGGVSILSIQDVIIRFLSGGYPVHEIVFIRAFFSMIVVLLIVRYEGGFPSLRTKKRMLQFIRGSLAFCGYTFFYMGIAVLPLATAITIFYMAPLIVTALSVPLLKEHVGVHRWIAVMVGFGGVALIANPQGGELSWGIVFAILAAAAYSGVILTTRMMGGTETSSSMSFYSILIYITFSSAIGLTIGDGAYALDDSHEFDFLLRAWVFPSAGDFSLISLCGLIWGPGFYLLTRAYMLASAVTVAPFEYSSMPLAILWGYIFWHEIPGANTVYGIVLIIGAGIYIIHRESRAKRAKA